MRGIVDGPAFLVDVQITEQDMQADRTGRFPRRRDCYDGPDARACRHAIGPRFHSVAVDGRVLVLARRGRHRCILDCESPEQDELARWIARWDRGESPPGIVFTLRVPLEDGPDPRWSARRAASRADPRPIQGRIF